MINPRIGVAMAASRSLVRPRPCPFPFPFPLVGVACLSTVGNRPQRSDSWLATFARELRAELRPARDVPGLVTTSLFDTELWERLPPDAVRFAARQAWAMSVIEWRTAWDILSGRPPRALEHVVEEEARVAAAGAAAEEKRERDERESGGADVPLSKVADSARVAALLVASRLSNVAHDEDLRARLTAMGTEALRLARDALDEFLLGYQEGKGDEIRIFISEELARESGFVERIKKIRGVVGDTLIERDEAGGGLTAVKRLA